jgi:GNAT superfamily N-acetyltransferase
MKNCYRYHHIGIPTKVHSDQEEYLPEYKLYHHGYEESEFGIEWMLYDEGCSLPEIIRTVPHVAFQVDDLEEAIKGKKLLIEPNSPSTGVKVAFIEENGAPIELIQEEDTGAKGTEGQAEVLIRKAVPADAPSIAELIRSLGYFGFISAEAADATAGRTLKHLLMCLRDDSHMVLVAVKPEGRVMGYVSVHWLPYLFLPGPEGYISELFIHSDFRGQGIGGRLLEAVRGEAVQAGCARLMLVNLRERESYQRQFYSKHGWKERPAMANFVFDLTGAK